MDPGCFNELCFTQYRLSKLNTGSTFIDGQKCQKCVEIKAKLQPSQRLSATWKPRISMQSHVGALEDTSAGRLSEAGDLQQVLNNKPAGFDRPYRLQQ